MSQQAYNIDQNAAVLGMLADSAFKHTDSKIAKGAIPVGRGVSKVVGSDDQVRLPAQNNGVLLFAGDFVASNQIDLDINGVAITPVVWSTDQATTLGLLATEIEANADVATAVVSALKTITVTGVDGTVIVIDNIVVTLGGSQTTGTWTGGTADSLYGIAQSTQILESGLPGEDTIPTYSDADVANILRRGSIHVQFETPFNPDSDTLYCRFVAGGATELIGQFRNDSDSGKAFAVAGNVQAKSTLIAAGLGIIELNKPV